MKLRHPRLDEEAALRERIDSALHYSTVEDLGPCDMSWSDRGSPTMITSSGALSAFEIAALMRAGIHPTAEGWMVDDDHDASEEQPPNGDRAARIRAIVEARLSRGGTRAVDLLLHVLDWPADPPLDPKPNMRDIDAALASLGAVREGDRWHLPAAKPATPPRDQALADRIAALVADHVRDTVAERDAAIARAEKAERALAELRAGIEALQVKVRGA